MSHRRIHALRAFRSEKAQTERNTRSSLFEAIEMPRSTCLSRPLSAALLQTRVPVTQRGLQSSPVCPSVESLPHTCHGTYRGVAGGSSQCPWDLRCFLSDQCHLECSGIIDGRIILLWQVHAKRIGILLPVDAAAGSQKLHLGQLSRSRWDG